MVRWIGRHAVALNFSAVAVLLIVLASSSMWARAASEGPPASGTPAAAEAKEKPPLTWQDSVKMFAAALAIGLTAFATAITQTRIGSAGVGALAENPKLFGSILVYLVIPETMVILGFVIAALIVF
jgi:V/A-type H+/Na+-transporting ATPase subunit K